MECLINSAIEVGRHAALKGHHKDLKEAKALLQYNERKLMRKIVDKEEKPDGSE